MEVLKNRNDITWKAFCEAKKIGASAPGAAGVLIMAGRTNNDNINQKRKGELKHE